MKTQAATHKRSTQAALLIFLIVLITVTCARLASAYADPPQLKTASSHPIQYYLALPEGWKAGEKWPVVVVIESADREFLEAATLFSKARKREPFIIVTPLVVTNGGAGYRSVPTYHYSDPVWQRIEATGQFNFDFQGIRAIMKDLVNEYGAEDKYFVTGFEAGGHTVWGILFNHPEDVRGAALVCPNYLGRWVDAQNISRSPERASVAIRNFIGTKDELCSEGRPIYMQMQRAMDLANSNGYRNLSLSRVEGKGHERLAAEVLAYFSSLLSN